MASSGTYLFDPVIAEIVDEAFERCGVDPAKITGRHIISARRSLNLLFVEWAARGLRRYTIEQQSLLLSPGLTVYDLPIGTIDILEAVLRRSGFDVPMRPIGLNEYNKIPKKDQRGRPDRYYVDRKVNPARLYIWQVSDQASDYFIYWRFRQAQDAAQSSQTPGVTWIMQEAIAAGLAYKLAQKWAPDKYGDLKQEHESQLTHATLEDRERGVLSINPEM